MIETVTKMVKLIENYLKNVFTLCLSGGFAAVSCRSSTQKSLVQETVISTDNLSSHSLKTNFQ
jgi:hypothetical protein